MTVRRHNLIALAFLAVVAGWALIEVLTVGQTGLLYLAPALLMALPLLLGRYLGEERIAALVAKPRRVRPRRARSARLPRGVDRVMQRGGRLVGSSMAKRPPPAPARLSPV
jgi:fatty acid desaturase